MLVLNFPGSVAVRCGRRLGSAGDCGSLDESHPWTRPIKYPLPLLLTSPLHLFICLFIYSFKSSPEDMIIAFRERGRRERE